MAEMVSSGEVARLMAGFRQGDRASTHRLVELFYPELRRAAARRIGSGHTWQPTALVHELYLQLIRIKSLPSSDSSDERSSFLHFCGFLMKRLLSHHERPLYRRVTTVPLDDEIPSEGSGEETLQHLDGILSRLAAIDPRLRQVAELRIFAGMTGDEIASELKCTRRTVVTFWNFAKQAIAKEMWSSPSSEPFQRAV